MNIAVFSLTAILLALNIRATIALIRSPSYDVKQKLIQSLLIWLLPVLGAILVWSLATETPDSRVTTDFADRFGYDDGDIRLDSYTSDGGSNGGNGH